VHSQCQSAAQRVDLLQHVRQGIALVAKNVQHRAEDLVGQFVQAFDLDQGRGDKRATARDFMVDSQRTHHAPPPGLHRLDVLLDAGAGRFVDHRPHVDTQAAWVAELQFAHRPFQHLDQARRQFALDAQHPQRRTALAGTVECGGKHVAHHLFGQRG